MLGAPKQQLLKRVGSKTKTMRCDPRFDQGLIRNLSITEGIE
ncbi:hypothetical protein [Prosthecobacter sp.]|nr:hypothetical protein [Prosthecobacter sp.]